MKIKILFFGLHAFLLCCVQSAGSIYAPREIPCPQQKILRRAVDIADEEKRYLRGMRAHTSQAYMKFITDLQIPDLDTTDLFENTNASSVKIGLAFSGGGLRALFTGAGALSALDNRVDHSWQHNLGGLLQASSYMSGLSGGGWLIGSYIFNGMMTIPDLLESGHMWNFDGSLFLGGGNELITAFNSPKSNFSAFNESLALSPESYPLQSTVNYYKDLHEEVSLKQAAGFRISLTDYWSRALARKLVPAGTTYGSTWSDITKMEFFRNHSLPFPILLAIALEPGEHTNSSRSTIVEFTPYEFGSWTHTIDHFAKIKYIGSHLDARSQLQCEQEEDFMYNADDDDKYADDEDESSFEPHCFQGMDNACFVMGTSSSLFNDVLYFYARNAMNNGKNSFMHNVRQWLDRHGLLDNDIYRQFALYYKNPFYGVPAVDTAFTRNDTLYLADGGEDGQNLPLDPLLRPERKLDVIIAVDATSDVNNYPNGSAIFRPTWRYHTTNLSKGVKYPTVPPEIELTKRQDFRPSHLRKPLFLGCSLHQYDLTETEKLPPLLIYVPNSYYSALSNRSTMAIMYSKKERVNTVQNGYNVMTGGNSSDWSQCVGCATLLREFQRQGTQLNQVCQSCFDRYCVN